MKMVTKSSRGIACKMRLMIYRPIDTSGEQKKGRKLLVIVYHITCYLRQYFVHKTRKIGYLGRKASAVTLQYKGRNVLRPLRSPGPTSQIKVSPAVYPGGYPTGDHFHIKQLEHALHMSELQLTLAVCTPPIHITNRLGRTHWARSVVVGSVLTNRDVQWTVQRDKRVLSQVDLVFLVEDLLACVCVRS